MELKQYQADALDRLNEYLKAIQEWGNPKQAFIQITNSAYKDEFFNDIPYICVKMPTGGGKTLVGCHSVDKIMNTVLKNKMERGIVMWFVPSEAIKTQTINKLKDRRDAHRQVLDEAFENGVRIFSNEEALRIRKSDVEDNLCIIVSSLEAFRKEKTLQNKYKVYQENGDLLDHFQNLEDDSILEKDEEGSIIFSLANVIKLSNPLVVIDEGHRTQTLLSIEFLKDLNPSFIIEFTATPRSGSNILVDVKASELKAQHMVKIPIVLESVTQWEQAIAQGWEQREELEKIAKKEKGEYIRPIALIQAQPKSTTQNNVTVEQVKEHLLKIKIKEEEIAIKVSGNNELDGVNLFSKDCPIKYIITVNALAEGWDCSFAYVLISLANIGSKISVEQIIGRILRMPNAKPKTHEQLNRSYVFASARNFNEAATEIIKGLECNGYSKSDIIKKSDEDKGDPTVVKKAFKEDFAVPMMSLNNEPLTFEELVGADFKLAEQDPEFDFEAHYDSDGKAILDIKDDKWVKGRQLPLNLPHTVKRADRNELVLWLDKKLRFTLLEQSDKVKFIEKALDYQLKKRSLGELSINRYVFCMNLDLAINDILVSHAKKNFDKWLSQKKITTKPFEPFPESITVDEEIYEEFNKAYYPKIEKLNSEELRFIERLDLNALPNIKFWIRNREKQENQFYLQGWQKNKFYPDFVAVTNKGNILALEWKGADRKENPDTIYKVGLAKIWESLGKGKLHFFLVHNENVEEVLSLVKKL